MNKTNMKKLKGFNPRKWTTNRWILDRALLHLECSFAFGEDATDADDIERARRINRFLDFEAVRWNDNNDFWFTSRLYTELNRLDEGVK